jgi:hypothetical protein
MIIVRVLLLASVLVEVSFAAKCPSYATLQSPYPKLLLSTPDSDVQATPDLPWTAAYHTSTSQLILSGYHGDWNICKGLYNPGLGCRVLAKYSTYNFTLDWIRQIDDPSLAFSNITYMKFNSDGTRLAAITEQSPLILMIFNTSTGTITKSVTIKPVTGYKLELKSVEVANNVLENEKPIAFLYLAAGNSTRKEYFGIITALKMELGTESLI